MFQRLLKTLAFSTFALSLGLSPAIAADEPVYIIIKADDLAVPRPDANVHPAWDRFAKAIESRNLKASVGVVSQCLEKDCPKLEAWVKEYRDRGVLEFWNHGYTHVQTKAPDGKELQEFKNASYEDQVETLRKCQDLSERRFGFKFAAFGSPFNGADENTAKALSQFPEIKVWMYGRKSPETKQLVLDRVMNLEVPIFCPNSEDVKKSFEALKNCKVVTLQGHPAMWKESGFVEFEKVLDYLVSKGAKFVTPSEYWKISTGG